MTFEGQRQCATVTTRGQNWFEQELQETERGWSGYIDTHTHGHIDTDAGLYIMIQSRFNVFHESHLCFFEEGCKTCVIKLIHLGGIPPNHPNPLFNPYQKSHCIVVNTIYLPSGSPSYPHSFPMTRPILIDLKVL